MGKTLFFRRSRRKWRRSLFWLLSTLWLWRLRVLSNLLEPVFLLFLAFLLQFLLTLFVLIVYFGQFGILSCC